MVSISACHAEDPGSIPGRGVPFFFSSHYLCQWDLLYSLVYLILSQDAHFFFQADCILLVGLAEKTLSESMKHVCLSVINTLTSWAPLLTVITTSVFQIVKQVETISIRVQKELVLLHRESVSHPSGTVKWLNVLGWLSAHFHVSTSILYKGLLFLVPKPICRVAHNK